MVEQSRALERSWWTGIASSVSEEEQMWHPQSPRPADAVSPVTSDKEEEHSPSSILLSPFSPLRTAWNGISRALLSPTVHQDPSPVSYNKPATQKPAKKKRWSYRSDWDAVPERDRSVNKAAAEAARAAVAAAEEAARAFRQAPPPTPQAEVPSAVAERAIDAHCGVGALLKTQPPWVQEAARRLLCIDINAL